MAYATVEEGGRIQLYGVLPSSYHSEIANVLGGFNKLPDEELARHGFYPVEYPTLTRAQQRGAIYFDNAAKVFKYNVLEKALPSVESLKISKLQNIKNQKTNLLEKTNEEVLEALELGEEIPNDIKEERASIRTQAKELEQQINNLTTSEALLDFTGSITTTTGSIL